MASEDETKPPRKRAAKKAAPAATEQPEIEPGDDDPISPEDLADMGITAPPTEYWTDERLADLRGEVAAGKVETVGDAAQVLAGAGLPIVGDPETMAAVEAGLANLDNTTPAASGFGGGEPMDESARYLRPSMAIDPDTIWVEVRVLLGPGVAGVPAKSTDGIELRHDVTADGVLYSALPPGVRARTVKSLIERAGREVLAQVPTGQRKRADRA